MKRVLLATIGICFLAAGAFSQNVFDPNDPIVTYNASKPPVTPPTNVIAKWVRTSRMSWNTSKFKAYYLNDMAFRLRFPNGYNPNDKTKKYPVIVFFHGGGEIAPVYDNDYQLLWGAQMFEQMINDGKFNAFLLFPQQKSVGWEETYFGRINNILDTLQQYCNADPDRVIPMGLSIGGNGVLSYSSLYPQRAATGIASSPSWVQLFIENRSNFIHVPTWVSSGGKDPNPDQWNVEKFVTEFSKSGGDVRWSFFPDLGHLTWQEQWAEPHLLPYWLNAHKANPLIFYKNKNYCPDEVAGNVKLGITAGFYAYEWQRNNVTIATSVNGTHTITDANAVDGFTGNEVAITQLGTYRVRFKRTETAAWSEFSPNPAVISAQNVVVTPAIAVKGLHSRVLPTPVGNTSVPLHLPGGYDGYQWKDLSTGAVISTSHDFDAVAGQYKAVVKDKNFCNSLASVFKVVDANGSPKPIAVSDLSATRVGGTNVQLNWTVETDPVNGPASYEVYRKPFVEMDISAVEFQEEDDNKGKGSKDDDDEEDDDEEDDDKSGKSGKTEFANPDGLELVAVTAPGVSSYLDQNLKTDKGYAYVLRPVNNNGAAELSNEAIVPELDVVPPTIPANLTVITVDKTFVELDWDDATDDNELSGYDVYVNNVKKYFVTESSIIADSLNENTTYQFSVKAVDATGNASGFSNSVTVTTLFTPDTEAPSVPQNLKVVKTDVKSIDLDWDNSTDNKGVTGYEIFVNGVYAYTSVSSSGVANNLQPNTTYTFSVKALDAAGNSSALSNSITDKTKAELDVTAPSVPGNLKVLSIATTSVTLDWDNATDNLAVTGYDIYVNGVKKYSAASSTVVAGNLLSNTTYTFTVKALDAAGNSSAFSSGVTAKTLTTLDVTAPSVPANLRVLTIGATTVDLDWDNATDNMGVTGYDVYVNGVKKYSATTSNIIAADLASNTSYTFTIKAIDAAGNNSAFSNAVVAKTLVPADRTAPSVPANLKVTAVTSSTVTLDWDNATDNVGVTGYDVYVNGVKKYSSTTSTIVANTLAANTSYSFTVKAVDAAGNISGASSAVTGKTAQAGDITAPTAPKSLKVVYTNRTGVELAWEKSTDNVGVTRYDVYVNGVKKYSTTGTAFVATGLTSYTTYKITVKAADQAGNISLASNQVTAVPLLIGLKYKYYEGAWSSLPNFNSLTAVKTGVTPDIDLNERRTGVNDNYGFVWEGFIKINTPGVYTFETRSDDGSKFYFNKTYVSTTVATVSNDGLHEAKSVASTVNITQAGVYPIAVTFFERTGDGLMKLYWKGPGFSRQEVPMSAFSDITSGSSSYLESLLAYFNSDGQTSNFRYTSADQNDNTDKKDKKDKHDNEWKNWFNANAAGTELSVITENEIDPQAAASLQITKAYPSPFVDVVNIEFTSNSSDSKVTVEVFDMYGKMMHSQHFGSTPAGKSRLVVNLDHKKLPAGLYLIRLNVDGKPSQAVRMMKSAN